MLQLSEFDIECVTPKAIKGKVFADLLADPLELSEEIPGEIEQIATIEDGQWTLYFDESSTAKEEGGLGIVLKSPKGESTSLSFKFEFPCSNNSSEYESLAIGLSIAKEMKINKLKVVGDSNLVVRQTDGTFALKEISLAPYQSLVQKLCDEIDVELTHVNRSTNRHADSLATLASKIKFEDDEAVIKISKRRTPAHGTLTISYMKMSLKKEIGDML